MKLTKDKKDIFDFLEGSGWEVEQDGRHFIATHPDADTAILFGGSHGWVIRRVRNAAREALGKPRTQQNRKRLERDAKKAERARLRQEWAEASAAQRRGEGAAFYEWAQEAVRRNWKPTKHFAQRMVERRINQGDITDALLNPVFIDLTKYEKTRETLPIFYGRRAVIVANVMSGELVTCYLPDKRPPLSTAFAVPRVVRAS